MASPSRRALSSIVVAHHADGAPVLVNESHALEPVGPRRGSTSGDLTGLRMWESAPYLIRYLRRHQYLVANRSVLDVGAGTGAVGLAAAAFGAGHVVLSDADSTATLATSTGWEERRTLQTLADNVALNAERCPAVSVSALEWGNLAHIAALRNAWPGGFDTILASDVLYYDPDDTYDKLALTLRALVSSSVDATIVLSYRVRHGAEHTFLERLLRPAAPGLDDDNSGAPFECVGRGAADAASLSEPSFATRVVELRRAHA